MPLWLTIILEVLPIFGDWMKGVFTSSDEEFEKISEAWPYPSKSRLARLRASQHAREHFGISDDAPAPALQPVPVVADGVPKKGKKMKGGKKGGGS